MNDPRKSNFYRRLKFLFHPSTMEVEPAPLKKDGLNKDMFQFHWVFWNLRVSEILGSN